MKFTFGIVLGIIVSIALVIGLMILNDNFINRPHALCVTKEEIIVSYGRFMGEASLRRMDRETGHVERYPVSETHKEMQVRDLAVDRYGDVYVAAIEHYASFSYRDIIVKVSAGGKELDSWQSDWKNSFYTARALGVTADDRLLVADIVSATDTAAAIRVLDFNGCLREEYSIPEEENSRPIDLAVGKNHIVALYGGEVNGFYWFSITGNHLMTDDWGQESFYGLSLGLNDQLFVIKDKRVKTHCPQRGKFVTLGYDHKFKDPEDIVVDEKGRIFVVDAGGFLGRGKGVYCLTPGDPYWREIVVL